MHTHKHNHISSRTKPYKKISYKCDYIKNIELKRIQKLMKE